MSRFSVIVDHHRHEVSIFSEKEFSEFIPRLSVYSERRGDVSTILLDDTARRSHLHAKSRFASRAVSREPRMRRAKRRSRRGRAFLLKEDESRRRSEVKRARLRARDKRITQCARVHHSTPTRSRDSYYYISGDLVFGRRSFGKEARH